MHITFYMPGRISIPPTLYGGTERVIYWLGKALVELGHQVTLIANAQSHIPGAVLRPIAPEETDPVVWQRLVPPKAVIVHLWDTPKPVANKPFLVTIEGNGRPGDRFHANTVFVSARHAAKHWSLSGELGVAYTGNPEVTLTTGNPGTVPQQDLNAEASQIEDTASKYKFFPILRIGVNYSF